MTDEATHNGMRYADTFTPPACGAVRAVTSSTRDATLCIARAMDSHALMDVDMARRYMGDTVDVVTDDATFVATFRALLHRRDL
jgi:hypothetical protein